MKIKYKTTSNPLYLSVQKVASDELAELQKLMQYCSVRKCVFFVYLSYVCISWFILFSIVNCFHHYFLLSTMYFGE